MAEVCSAFQRCSVWSHVPLEQDEMRVQLRIERARGSCARNAAPTKLPGDAILVLNAAFADACSGELLQLAERERGGFLVGLQDTPVIHRDGENGHRFGRSTLEVEEDAPLPGLLRRQLLPGHWLHVVAQSHERLPCDGFAGRRSQALCSLTDPVASLGLVLGVVIVV